MAIHGGRIFHGTWNDTKCDLAKPYICKISSGTPRKLAALALHPKTTTASYRSPHLAERPPPTPAPGNGMCLPFWHPYGRYCYQVYDGQQGFSWPDSRHYCQSIRGDLASLHSRAEVEFVRNLNYTKYHNVWIGLTRDSNCERRRIHFNVTSIHFAFAPTRLFGFFPPPGNPPLIL